MAEPKTYTEEEFAKELSTKTDAIRAELTSEREKVRTMKADMDSVKAELQKLQDAQKKTEDDKQKKELESKGQYDAALKKYQDETQAIIADRDKKIAELSATVTRYRVDGEILKAAEGSNKPEQVVTLIKSEYDITEKADGSIEIKGKDGALVLDKNTGKPLDLDGLAKGFLAENPHLVKPGNEKGGSNTRSGIPGTSRTAGDLDAQIAAAIKSGDRHEVIKLKARKMSLAGPHSQIASAKTG